MLALLTASAAVGCGDNGAEPSQTSAQTDGASTNGASGEETASGILTDRVPTLDFKGAEFRTLEQNSVATYELSPEENDGDVVSDAIWNRARSMEERFNVVIKPTVKLEYTTLSDNVTNSVMSDSDDYDLVFGQMYRSGADAQSGIFYDWNSIPYVDFGNPWYTKSIAEAQVGDKLYMIESDLSITYFQQTWMMLYNKTKAEEISDFPDLYALVREGKWTLDELNRLTADVYRDLNGDSMRDDGDFYGFAGTPGGCLLAAFVYGAGGKLAELDKELNVVQKINSERTLDILQKLSKLFTSNDGTIVKTDALSATRRELFPKGNVLFEAMQATDLIRSDFDMRNMNDEFGVLPLPKYNEEQEEYYTVVDGGASVMVVPACARNIEMIGALTEAMSAYSYSKVIPVYIGVALEQKGTRDEDSIQMMREILDSRVIDFAYLYDGFKGWVMQLTNYVKSPDSIASSIESSMSAMNGYYSGVVEFLTK